MKVLHVVEALGGGVATALDSYITNTPHLDHVVCGHRRAGHETGDGIAEKARFVALDDNPAGQAAVIWRAMRRERPDVVHAHSSLAGLYARLEAALRRCRVAYSPHCFAFERRDVPKALRLVYRSAERALAQVTDLFIVVSDHEADLARSLSRRTAVVVVPHAITEDQLAAPRTPRPGRRITVATVGRLMAQKGVDFFLETVREAGHLGDASGGGIDWQWVGGGSQESEDRVRAAGVSVTGWLPRAQAMATVADADVYVHTAGWEAGVPLAVIEAARMGLPVVVRAIPAVAELDPSMLTATPRAMAEAVIVLTDPERRVHQAATARTISCRYVPKVQAEALCRAYEAAAGR